MFIALFGKPGLLSVSRCVNQICFECDAVYVCLAIRGFVKLEHRHRLLFDFESIRMGLVCLVIAATLLAGDVGFDLDLRDHPMFEALMHSFAGGASFFLWKGVPSVDGYAKKADLLGGPDASSFI